MRQTDSGAHPAAPKLQAIVFDMDGLMVDTEPLSFEVWAALLREHGHELDHETYGRMIGRRTDESARLVLSRYPLPFSIPELVAHKSQLWEARWRQGVPAMPGLFELHEEIRRRGIPWAVATSSPRYYAEQILQQLGLWPTNGVFVGGDEVAHGKPAPDLYLLAAERLGIPAESCLALEDSVPGARAALAAGMQLIVVPAGTAPPGIFDFAPHVSPSLHEVAGRLDSFFGSS